MATVYLAEDVRHRRQVAVKVLRPELAAPVSPRALFPVDACRRARNHPQYDVAPDGRFVMIREPAAGVGAVYVVQWLPELLAKVKR